MNFHLQQLLVNSLGSGVRLVKGKVRVFGQFLTVVVRSSFVAEDVAISYPSAGLLRPDKSGLAIMEGEDSSQ